MNWLGAEVVEWVVDTDRLGTFSGEIEREGTPVECARRKCDWGLDELSAEFGLASEGSFGPHPRLPSVPCDQEILYFIDRKRNFHLHLTHLSTATNYQSNRVSSFDALLQFAEKAKFPSHALIVRPYREANRENRCEDESDHLFKGIADLKMLEETFEASKKLSNDGMVWVETDMRADKNPSRMLVIGELAEKLARRLLDLCPGCNAPGWGTVRVESGLPCEYCLYPTTMIAREIHGCVLCDHQVCSPRSDRLTLAPQQYCSRCNP
jgi:hypothetical protein